jgi:hypothetical protein
VSGTEQTLRKGKVGENLGSVIFMEGLLWVLGDYDSTLPQEGHNFVTHSFQVMCVEQANVCVWYVRVHTLKLTVWAEIWDHHLLA